MSIVRAVRMFGKVTPPLALGLKNRHARVRRVSGGLGVATEQRASLIRKPSSAAAVRDAVHLAGPA